MELYGYWRSSASYRVRIILALKDLDYAYAPINLLHGAQSDPAHHARNPQELVPALRTDEGEMLTQSLAIAEYLEERYPDPALLPDDLARRAQVRAVAGVIACEGQPLMNLRVQKYLKEVLDADEAALGAWLARWGGGAMAAVESLIAREDGPFAFGPTPTLADAFIIPQIYACTRFGIDLSACPRLNAIAEHCRDLPPFVRAHPDSQPDAPARAPA